MLLFRIWSYSISKAITNIKRFDRALIGSLWEIQFFINPQTFHGKRRIFRRGSIVPMHGIPIPETNAAYPHETYSKLTTRY